jgi:ABC-type multidrug transport system ATPase subunit
MRYRYYDIEDAHESTFDWIYKGTGSEARPWDDFSGWLTHGNGIYWINGKAGSGKSTLMRYIYDNTQTSLLLNKWVDTSGEPLRAGFFFWKSGLPEQASQIGLLRSLLHTLLSKKHNTEI